MQQIKGSLCTYRFRHYFKLWFTKQQTLLWEKPKAIVCIPTKTSQTLLKWLNVGIFWQAKFPYLLIVVKLAHLSLPPVQSFWPVRPSIIVIDNLECGDRWFWQHLAMKRWPTLYTWSSYIFPPSQGLLNEWSNMIIWLFVWDPFSIPLTIFCYVLYWCLVYVMSFTV